MSKWYLGVKLKKSDFNEELLILFVQCSWWPRKHFFHWLIVFYFCQKHFLFCLNIQRVFDRNEKSQRCLLIDVVNLVFKRQILSGKKEIFSFFWCENFVTNFSVDAKTQFFYRLTQKNSQHFWFVSLHQFLNPENRKSRNNVELEIVLNLLFFKFSSFVLKNFQKKKIFWLKFFFLIQNLFSVTIRYLVFLVSDKIEKILERNIKLKFVN